MQGGITIRSGHHCVQPILRRFGVEESARASFAIYNTDEDVERLVTKLHQICSMKTLCEIIIESDSLNLFYVFNNPSK